VTTPHDREVLQRSYRMGKWSWELNIGQITQLAPDTRGFFNTPIPVLQLQGMQPWDARPWTVNLNSWRTGLVFPTGLVTTRPTITPDMQLQSDHFARMRIEYGVDGVYETFDCDYPASGCSFTLTAATIRLYYYQLADSTTKAPKYSGFLAPSFSDQGDTLVRPMLTDTMNIPQNSGQSIAKPPRAVAYRAYFQDAVAAESTVVSQLAGITFANLKQDGTRPNTVAATNGDMLAGNNAQWWPLDPRTQWLSFVQSGGVNGNTVAIQWLLNVS
jgi:hypothetical protein